jgi:cold shock CspA family protein/uncharacterized LabA/DUF88 family protein
MNQVDNKLIRIGVFYDGNYFLHVSNYYNFSHHRRSRISISGLHEFVRTQVAQKEGVDERYCTVIDSHYFRGRLPAQEAKNRNKLLSERLFDDILMKESVVTHYLPLNLSRGEKGIDVWLAMEAYEACLLKRYNVICLLACDGDFVPLIRKIQALGTRVMVLGWDFEYTDEFGNKRTTVTSAQLLQEATYPVKMQEIIDDKSKRSGLVDNLFVPRDQTFSLKSIEEVERPDYKEGERLTGRIQNIKEGYGFIETGTPGRNLFFYWEDVDGDFNELQVGDLVEYSLGRNHRGECAVDVLAVDEDDYDEEDLPPPITPGPTPGYGAGF